MIKKRFKEQQEKYKEEHPENWDIIEDAISKMNLDLDDGEMWLIENGQPFVFTGEDNLKSLTIERVGDNTKFFGFGICQKATLKLIDKDREIETAKCKFYALFDDDTDNSTYTPYFYSTDIRRDENTNEISITAYDALYFTANYDIAPLFNMAGYETATPLGFAEAAANIMEGYGYNTTFNAVGIVGSFDTYNRSDINIEATATIRELLNAVAEATQTIYYISNNDAITFKQLDKSGVAVYTIGKDEYITLESKASRRLTAICHATELGDNIVATMEQSGTTQYIRDNPFWTLKDNVEDLVEAAVSNIGGLTINQYTCSWRGNYLLEIGDKINLITKDNTIATSFLLDDTIEYNGAFAEKSQWSYEESESETAAAPSNLGEALKQTYAKVDKVNKEIELVVNDVTENTASISAIRADTDGIAATVSSIQQNTENALSGINNSIQELETQITQTADSVKIEVKQELKEEGVESVRTATGFVFDDSGLTIHESGKEITTNINNNGMTVYKNEEAVLTANEKGVVAVDLHANTYLLIGDNSRFEDWTNSNNSRRTACFWVGVLNG